MQREKQKGTNEQPAQPVRVIFEPEVRQRLGGIAHSTLWRWLRAKELPSPIRIGKRRNGWIESDINHYIATRQTAPAFRGQMAEAAERV